MCYTNPMGLVSFSHVRTEKVRQLESISQIE